MLIRRWFVVFCLFSLGLFSSGCSEVGTGGSGTAGEVGGESGGDATGSEVDNADSTAGDDTGSTDGDSTDDGTSTDGSDAGSGTDTGDSSSSGDSSGGDTAGTGDGTGSDGSSGTDSTDDTSGTGGHDDGTGDSGTGNGTPTDGGDDCEEFQFALKPDPASVAKVVLVVDRSYSMLMDEDRWTPMVTALGEMTSTLDELVDFGLMLFPNPAVPNECAVGSVQIEPEPETGDNINLVLSLYGPDMEYGGTPTADSLAVAGEALVAMNPDGDNNYILLATDGGPGCNYDLDYLTCECLSEWCWELPANCLDDRRTIDTVLNLNLDGVKTFVIGIPGSEEFATVLDEMAIAGGTAVNNQHYAVSSADELSNALSATTGNLVPCVYEVEQPVDDVNSVIVRIDGIPIPHDVTHVNGWDYMDSNLHFYGEACAMLRDGEHHGIRAIYDCGL
jgi:hypothetical protein